jgi:hypothetical protein
MNEADPKNQSEHDEKSRRCPRLGHEIAFGYCRQTDASTPCTKLLDCWFETFDVADWAKKSLAPRDLEKLTAAPKPKMLSLVELIQQARQRTDAGDADS